MQRAKPEKWKFDRATVVYDVDGVVIDDITLKLERGFPSEGRGAARRAYAEGLFNMLRLRPFRRSAIRGMTEEAKRLNELEMDERAAAHMHSMGTSGVGVAICTSNPFYYSRCLGRLLHAQGIDGVDIKIAWNGNKAELIPSKNVLVIEDDPMVALHLAREGVEVILLSKDYNPLLGHLFGAMNGNLHVARNWEEVERISLPLLKGGRKKGSSTPH